MERITPPFIPEDRREVTVDDIVVPREGIMRAAFLGQYQNQMSEPTPEPKATKTVLAGWSGALGKTEWLREDAAGAANFLRVRTFAVQTGYQLREILGVLTDYVDPLTRYSAGWADSLAALRVDRPRRKRVVHRDAPGAGLIDLDDESRPKRAMLRGRVGGALRQLDQAAANAVRAQMARDGVIRSREDVERFLDDPHVRHADDALIAVHKFLDKLLVKLEARRIGLDLNDYEVALLIDLIDDLSDTEGEALALREAAMEARRQTVDVDVEKILKRNFELFLDEKARGEMTVREVFELLTNEQALREEKRYLKFAGWMDRIPIAYESVRITYRNNYVKGVPIEESGRYFRLRLTSKKIDEFREQVRRAKLTESLDSERGRKFDRANDEPELTGAARVAIAAAERIGNDPGLRVDGVLCWEGEFAKAELLRLAGDDDLAEAARPLAERVREKWALDSDPSTGLPDYVRSTSDGAAVQDIDLLLRTAIYRVEIANENQEGSAS